MGYLLPNYKKSVIDDIISGISTNTANYFAFASNPTGNSGSNTADDYTTSFSNDWNLLFGKQITSTDVIQMINNNVWQSNVVYTQYDNTVANLSNYYVITNPSLPGGSYNVYKCINNANGAPSTAQPDQIQASSFTKTADGYTWRYITSISSAQYSQFASAQYVPIYPNTSIQAVANNYAGVENIIITNIGSGYSSYFNGTVQFANSSVIQIDSSASTVNDIYTNNAIYLINSIPGTNQLLTVSGYVHNTSGNWVFVNPAANTSQIIAGSTQYSISPRIQFTCDGASPPIAYTTVNPSTNTIQSITIIQTGSDITWANAVIISNSVFGSGATIRPILPPPGGHGSNPASELGCCAVGFSFKFSNTESNTIPTNIQYSQIGLIKNPYVLNTNNTKGSNLYNSNTFNSTINATINPTTSFTYAVGETVVGQTTGALGTVAYANSSALLLSGDTRFTNENIISTSNPAHIASIQINSIGQVYKRDIVPLYVQNISNVTRSNTTSESFKLIIQV
jgi:hypothetical protein